MALKLTTPPTATPVTLAELKDHLRFDGDDTTFDADLQAKLFEATELAEQATNRAFMPQTWQLTLDAFPPSFILRRVPVQAIQSITYADLEGNTQPLPPAAYVLDNADDDDWAYIVPALGTDWPATQNRINAVQVTFLAGYATPALVPTSVKSWVKLTVGSMDVLRAGESPVQAHRTSYADRLLDRATVYGS